MKKLDIEILSGHYHNAAAGWLLTLHKTKKKKFDTRTGAGPDYWSSDGKMVCIYTPFPGKWADLYQVWNMAFVSKLEDWPYFITKLLVPGVGNYQADPRGYMYPRVIALFLAMSWFAFINAERKNRREPLVSWYDPELTRWWGEENRKYTLHYKNLVREARR